MSQAAPRTAAARARRRTPLRDNIEALVVAVVMAVFLKYFVVEAYKIPTGSMQPTLMGQAFADGGGVFDRILVDKLSYHFRDPQRFEVTVFRYPLNRARNYVKRLVGMPGEELRIAHGDLFVRGDPSAPFRPLRRPRAVQAETWKWLDRALPEGLTQWKVESGEWSAAGNRVGGAGPGRALFVGHGGGAIMDRYLDGYPAAIAARVSPRGEHGTNAVGDLRLVGRVRARPQALRLSIELVEGDRNYRFELPGPAAASDARPRVAVVAGAGTSAGGAGTATGEARRLPAERWVEFAVQNLDDLLELELDGEVVAALEVAPAALQTAGLRLIAEGGGADFERLRVARDIYYTPGRQGRDTWSIPEGHYFMLGDNTQDSSDSREWTFWNMAWADADGQQRQARGNWHPYQRGANPLEANPLREPTLEGRLTWFTDEWGETHLFPTDQELARDPQSSTSEAPLVPRELIAGRALLVFWPLSPGLRLWRLTWVH
jgi:signal peptidase I